MKKVLIASVGGSPEPIVNAIVQERPDFVYFLCSTGKSGSDETVEKTIVPGTQLREGSYVITRVQSPHDLRNVVAACSTIEADLDTRFAGEELNVLANYTGGTRTMSAGLVSLAQRRGWDAEVTERPTRPWCGPINRVALEAVTVFKDIELSCAEGINVILGENGTGKTHLLKCMYALLRSAEETDTPVLNGGDKLARVFAGRFRSAFAGEHELTRVSVECGEFLFERVEPVGAPAVWSLPMSVRPRALFLPSRETLAMYEGFVRLYEDRKVAFDETYYDLCKELGQLELREPPPAFAEVLAELEEIIGGSVRLDVTSFVVDTKQGPVAALMLAEGHRKLAALAYLIKNGALKDESVLFWDEPEANLNPKLVRRTAGVIRKLARAGVQIFVATHDYLLARDLSLEAEYKPGEVDNRFFALYRTSEEASVEVESGALWGTLQHNPIFEAYAAHYDREQDLFAGATEEGLPS
jgi:ABC-type lipoprotein export system ATPase subunit